MKKPRKSNNKKYYYHISQQNFGNSFVLKPRIYGRNRSNDEPIISRICVSESIANCFLSVFSCFSFGYKIYIYRTKNKVTAYYPFGVYDSKITKEMWILNETKFIKLGKINTEMLPNKLDSFPISHINEGNSNAAKILRKVLTASIPFILEKEKV